MPENGIVIKRSWPILRSYCGVLLKESTWWQ